MSSESEIKIDRLGTFLDRRGLDGVLLTRRENFAWITCGRDNHIPNNSPQGIASILATRDGQRIQGVRKAEDAFSIQIMDTHERLQGYLKSNVREVVRDKTSLMPDFGPDRLSAQDLDDVVAYLATFRAAPPARRPQPAADDR